MLGEASDVHVFKTRGPYNVEFTQTLEQFFAHYEAQRAARYATMYVVTGSMLMSPDCLLALSHLIERFSVSSAMPAALAYVVAPDVEGRVNHAAKVGTNLCELRFSLAVV